MFRCSNSFASAKVIKKTEITQIKGIKYQKNYVIPLSPSDFGHEMGVSACARQRPPVAHAAHIIPPHTSTAFGVRGYRDNVFQTSLRIVCPPCHHRAYRLDGEASGRRGVAGCVNSLSGYACQGLEPCLAYPERELGIICFFLGG